MNILIVGGAGFVGANLVRRCLLDATNQVTVLDSLEPRLQSDVRNLGDVWSRMRFVRGSMSDEPLIADVVQGMDVIFNCAGQTSHTLSLVDPLFDAELNCLGNLRLLEATRLLNPRATVLYTSSSTVVGRAVGEVVDEDHAERPLDIYSANKGVAEKYYRIYNRVHDIKTVVLRFANLYGPYGKGSPDFSFINYFIHLAWTRKEIQLYGSGEQTRNVLYVGDAVEALYRAAQTPELIGETYFAAHDEHLSVREIAEQVVAVFQRGSIRQIDWPDQRRRIDVEHVRISSEKFRAASGWRPAHSFVEGLRATKRVLEEDSGP